MTFKKRLSGWITTTMSLCAISINAFGDTKALKAPRRPKIPKTPADYEALRVAELKRRRKAETRIRNQHNQEA